MEKKSPKSPGTLTINIGVKLRKELDKEAAEREPACSTGAWAKWLLERSPDRPANKKK